MKYLFAFAQDYWHYVFTWDFFYIGFIVILAASIIGCKQLRGEVKVNDLVTCFLIACMNQPFAVMLGIGVLLLGAGLVIVVIIFSGAVTYKYLIQKPWNKIKDKKIL
jgi:hypothetical protein